MNKLVILTIIFFSSTFLIISCTKSIENPNKTEPDIYTINYGDGIHFIFDEGLNNNPEYQLEQNEDGYYLYPLYSESQNIQRISVRLLNSEEILYSNCCGNYHSIRWDNNLYWWLLEGDTTFNVTQTYFNPFTGEIQYVNLPPMINFEDFLIPTINHSSITDDNTGRTSTVIGPIGEMRGDTMKIYVTYSHQITKKLEGSTSYEVIGERKIVDSVSIILE